jgi:hypothetical protein
LILFMIAVFTILSVFFIFTALAPRAQAVAIAAPTSAAAWALCPVRFTPVTHGQSHGASPGFVRLGPAATGRNWIQKT